MEEKREMNAVVTVRVFDPRKDCPGVDDVERRCEVGPPGKMTLVANLLGDPISRIRNSPSFLMLVAEMAGPEGEIVGMIRGCIKTVTCGKKVTRSGNTIPIFTKVAYILGLRVSPSHRRMGIGLKLVNQLEEWFKSNGAEYSYMSTESENKPSLNLFTTKCSYTKFRTPSILVQPVFAHRVRLHNRVTIIKLTPSDSEFLYRSRFSTTEFFPRDIDRIVNNTLTLGTFIAVPVGSFSAESWPGSDRFLSNPPDSWAVMSTWNCKEVFTLQVQGASYACKVAVRAARVLDEMLPWFKLPSVPNVFKPFGVQMLYGLGGEGPRARRMVKALCGHAHNLAMQTGGELVVTEVASQDPLKLAIPNWKKLSCAEDTWFIKRLVDHYSDGPVGDWTKSPPGVSIFVDPREF